MSSKSILLHLLAGAICLSTSVSEASAQPIGRVSSPLQSPYETSLQEQEELGLVTLGGSCSGVLITNDWVLTAMHCIAGTPSLVVTAAWDGGQARRQTNTVLFAPFDIAIFQVDRPFRKNGSTSGYFAPLDTRGVSRNENTILIYGRGRNVFATRSGGVDHPSSRDGKYRSGPVTLSAVRHGIYEFRSGAISVVGGDSGGPSYRTSVSGIRGALLGVTSNCQAQYLSGKPRVWDWAVSTDHCTAVSVHPFVDRIKAEIASRRPAESPPEQLERHADGSVLYRNPRLMSENGVRLLADNCRTFGANCGKEAADAFCVYKGMAGATAWKISAPGATTIISDRRECLGPVCRGFKEIRCDRAPERNRVTVETPIARPRLDTTRETPLIGRGH